MATQEQNDMSLEEVEAKISEFVALKQKLLTDAEDAKKSKKDKKKDKAGKAGRVDVKVPKVPPFINYN